MASETTLMGLLKTPSQVRKEAQERLMQESLARSQQMITGGGTTALPGILSRYGAQAAQRGAMAGAGLLRGITGGLGTAVGGDMGQRIADLGIPVEERQARAQQQAMQGYQPGNLQSMKATYEQLKKTGANPQVLAQLATQIQKQEEVVRTRLQEQKQRSSAVSYLNKVNPDIAQLVASGSMPIADGIKTANKALEPITVGKSVIAKKPGTDTYEVVYSAPPEAKASYRLLTEQQIAANPTLTPGVAYQENEKTGEISAITGDPKNAQVGDYQIRRSYDDNNNLSISMEVIPGSETDKKQKEANRVTGLGLQSKKDKVDLMDRAISKSIDLLKEDPDIADWQGALIRVLGRKTGDVIGAGSKTAILDTLLTTIKSNLGFDKLQRMRDESPTGGALGQVAVVELIALQNSIAPLDPKQGATELTQNLEYILDTYRTNMEKLANSYDDATLRQYGLDNAIQFRTQDAQGNPLPTEGEAPADPLGIRR